MPSFTICFVVCLSWWTEVVGAQGDVAGAVAALSKMDDLAAAVDFLNSGETAIRAALTLNLCCSLLPTLKQLLTGPPFESYVTTALRYLLLLLQSFTGIILEHTSHGASRAGPVDISHEERRRKCSQCLDHFHSLRGVMAPLTAKYLDIGPLARQAHEALDKLLAADRRKGR